MTVQEDSTRQIALDELAKLNHLIEVMKTVEVRLPDGFYEALRNANYEEALIGPVLAPVVDSRPVSTEQLQQMEKRFNKRLGMQLQYRRAMMSEVRSIRRLLIANIVMFGSLLILMWQ